MSATTTHIQLEELVETELPPLPSIALRVANMAQDFNTPGRALAEVIGYDPALASRLLRAVNSPLYGLERTITALPVAVNTMGNHAILMLVMMYTAHDSFLGKNNKQTPAERALWEHSVAVALAARETSHALGMRGAEESFLCGLLHDIGKLLMLRHDADYYRPAQATTGEHELLECELELYGYTHEQVGALAAKRWGLPEQVCHAIHYHHKPGESPQGLLMARVLDVADALCNAAGLGLRKQSPDMHGSFESAMALRLTDAQLDAIWTKAEGKLRDTMKMLS